MQRQCVLSTGDRDGVAEMPKTLTVIKAGVGGLLHGPVVEDQSSLARVEIGIPNPAGAVRIRVALGDDAQREHFPWRPGYDLEGV